MFTPMGDTRVLAGGFANVFGGTTPPTNVYGVGGTGGAKRGPTSSGAFGGAGRGGIVIVEEFY
jgi:hypothetical protein